MDTLAVFPRKLLHSCYLLVPISLFAISLFPDISKASPPFEPFGLPINWTIINGLPSSYPLKNSAVKGFSQPLGYNVTTSYRITSVFSAEMLTKIVQNYHAHVTTFDTVNEEYYTRSRIGDNVWFNIERVLPFRTYIKWLLNTTRIIERYDPTLEKMLIDDFIQKPGVACAPESAFEIPRDVIMDDNPNRRFSLDDLVNKWHIDNADTPPQQMCNRYRGLQCSPLQNSSYACQCESDRIQFVEYMRTGLESKPMYRDSCYVKAWKRCDHLSMDSNIPNEYKAYHAHPDNMKQFLIRMATPLPHLARCERGSYCVDMVLNTKKPICWCSSRQYSKDCFNTNGSVPMLERFLAIRKSFHQMMISESDRQSRCSLDRKLDDNLRDIQVLLANPEKNFMYITRLMKDVLENRMKGMRFCDFRKGMACDPHKRVCTYKTGCGPGRVYEITDNKKVCKVNNGYPCPTLEFQCIRGAECKDFGQGKHCHCQADRFGDLCRFETPTFFGTLLQSRVSGFVGYHFVYLQEVVNHVLIPLERLMTLQYGQPCNPNLDYYAMNIIKYLGNVREVVLDQMDGVLGAVQHLVGRDEPLCDYKAFLGCASVSAVCEPMVPDVAIYDAKISDNRQIRGASGKTAISGKVTLTLRDFAKCWGPGNYTNVPAIFMDLIHVQCMEPHECRRPEKNDTASEPRQTFEKDAKYCLCSIGFQGERCKEKIPEPVKVNKIRHADVYELPQPVVIGPIRRTVAKSLHRNVIGRVR